ncbi:MAG TPA: SCO family protein [Verrucomicrobiae bacterium]|nr:SCO family protein [Verrucomicrobiae bacterium]
MRSQFLAVWILLLANFLTKSAGAPPSLIPAGVRIFPAKGIVEKIQMADATVVVKHEAVSNFMSAMTMPFPVKDKAELSEINPGDEISFRLYVTGTESWIGEIKKIGIAPVTATNTAGGNSSSSSNVVFENSLLALQFTNEFGQPVTLNDFRGQARAITFFYTRCPLPNFCPRLSKNFQEAQEKLEAMSGAPTNWHFISISFDPEFDSPQTLKNYGDLYHYDSNHWTFLTGSPDQIARLARAVGVEYEPDSGTINHNFRTLIFDASGRLRMIFPTSGDLSDQIVSEILKAAATTNPAAEGQK